MAALDVRLDWLDGVAANVWFRWRRGRSSTHVYLLRLLSLLLLLPSRVFRRRSVVCLLLLLLRVNRSGACPTAIPSGLSAGVLRSIFYSCVLLLVTDVGLGHKLR